MTHDELLAKIDSFTCCSGTHEVALRAVVELHKPEDEPFQGVFNCAECTQGAFASLTAYPCPTIQAIEKELQ